ncbi:MAG: hypothetical protein HFF18_04020 [Oscillospiraceae bacterium]|nr:hypothetical protein [Oscillospiraceae bacterium]
MNANIHLPRLFLALALVLALIPSAALADESTTTRDSAYKDLDPRTEIYAVTSTPAADYPYFGAKNEPSSGVYYGRTCEGGTLPNGQYGLVNQPEMADESIIGFYYDWQMGGYSLEYWNYMYGPALEEGNRGLMVYLNFANEGADCASIAYGAYDSQLIETFTYMNTLSCPTFVRIGGEMNVWNTATTPAEFIPAYQHVAELARAYSPNTALVFSVNYSSAHLVDMDTFYPGDQYVDWVGVSLYYNLTHHSGNTTDEEFLGSGTYGDPMLNIQQTVNLARLHNKPVMITEGGAGNTYNGEDISWWASERMQKAFSFLPMVYPEVKCIISSDYQYSWEPISYKFYNQPVMTAAYRQAVASNPTFLHSYHDTASYYTKLSSYTGPWSGEMTFAAYSYAPTKLAATWLLDGQIAATALEYPYSYTLNVDALPAGAHTLQVLFDNGATVSYPFTSSGGSGAPVTPAVPSGAAATPTNDKLYVDGVLQNATVYKIDGSNYFKLRDIAAMLAGTEKQFDVGYDPATGVTVLTGLVYMPNGSELAGAATGGSKEAIVSNDAIYVDGVKLDLSVYKIDGSNYFKLRDLGQALDFYVGYDPAAGVTLSGNAAYEG